MTEPLWLIARTRGAPRIPQIDLATPCRVRFVSDVSGRKPPAVAAEYRACDATHSLAHVARSFNRPAECKLPYADVSFLCAKHKPFAVRTKRNGTDRSELGST